MACLVLQDQREDKYEIEFPKVKIGSKKDLNKAVPLDLLKNQNNSKLYPCIAIITK